MTLQPGNTIEDRVGFINELEAHGINGVGWLGAATYAAKLGLTVRLTGPSPRWVMWLGDRAAATSPSEACAYLRGWQAGQLGETQS